eukprot:TRINITY_DN1661_c0_g1_i5.p1 TRINITY_DN1661_c0_g1~~TRINITY_DN1661_c0_g1_i5.p1  ORF type:complete len:412 (+),score=55.09 TRINITY_DN1661_c0_g1_i5:618-1853(+)
MFLFPVSGRISNIAEAAAMGDHKLVGKRILFSFVTAIVVGLLVGLVLFLVQKPLIGSFTSDETIQNMIYPFYGLQCAIIPLNMVTVVIVGVFETWNKTYWMLFIFMLRNGLDALFNYLTIDVMKYQILYASAVATSVAATFTNIVGLAYILRPHHWSIYFADRSWLDFAQFKVFKSDHLYLGGKTFLGVSIAVLSAVFANQLNALTPHFICFLFFWWASDVAEALGSVNSVVGSMYMLERRYKAKRQLDKWMTFGGLLLGIALAVLYYLLRTELPKVFTADSSMQQLIEGTIWTYLCFSALIMGVNGVLEGSISAMGKYKYQFFVMVLAIATFITLGSVCVYLNKPLNFLWLALLIYQGTRLIPSFLLIHWYLRNELKLKSLAFNSGTPYGASEPTDDYDYGEEENKALLN